MAAAAAQKGPDSDSDSVKLQVDQQQQVEQGDGGAGAGGGGRPLHPLLARSLSCRTRRSSQASSVFSFRLRPIGSGGQSEGEAADDEVSVPGDVLEEGGGAGGAARGAGRTYSGSTFSGLVVAKRRPSTYSNTSRSSQVLQLRDCACVFSHFLLSIPTQEGSCLCNLS